MNRAAIALLCPTLLLLSACGDKAQTNVAPEATAALTADKPATASAVAFTVDSQGSKASFTMDAPFEKIHGDMPGGLSGEIFIDPQDLSKSTGLIKADLLKLELFQQKRDDEKAEYGERVKSDKQNEHARTWLEISPDAPEEARKNNAMSEFKLTKLSTDTADLTKLSGASRKVTGTLTGELRAHGRKLEKTTKFEATFDFEGDKLVKVSIKTEPLKVGLEEYDIKPRDAFGSLAQKTLGDMAGKVSDGAPVSVELVATRK